MAFPLYTADEAQARAAFLALMWALSYPGQPHDLPAAGSVVAALTTIGTTLLDLETSFYTPDADLRAALSRTGARDLTPGEAAYHFYPALDAVALEALAKAKIGTMIYPDEATTIILGCRLAGPAHFTLAGPGVDGTRALTLGEIPPALWTLRESRRRYPLGWDIFLTDGAAVIGVPRSTHITCED